MSGYLYKGYCYPSINDVKAVFSSQGVISVGDGPAMIDAVTVGGNPPGLTAQLNWFVEDLMTGDFTIKTATYNQLLPSCDFVGPFTNESGLSIPDTIELAWLVVAVWVSAWAIRTMRGRG